MMLRKRCRAYNPYVHTFAAKRLEDYLSDGQRVEALKGLSLEADAGICGAGGTKRLGKSTLLILPGPWIFLPRVRCWWREFRRRLERCRADAIEARKVGFIFQSFQLLHTLTVFENWNCRCSLREKHARARLPREAASSGWS